MMDADTARHERELGTLSKGLTNLEGDVNQIAEEARSHRHGMRNDMAAMELRVNKHVDERVNDLEARIDRMITTWRWVVGLSVPAVCTLLGLLIGKS